jgi:hypothetical protein
MKKRQRVYEAPATPPVMLCNKVSPVLTISPPFREQLGPSGRWYVMGHTTDHARFSGLLSCVLVHMNDTESLLTVVREKCGTNHIWCTCAFEHQVTVS